MEGAEDLNDSGSVMADFPILRPSQEVIEKQGKPRVENTEQGVRTAVNAWCSIQLGNMGLSFEEIQNKDEEWLLLQMKKQVMPDASKNTEISDAARHNLNVSLGEFVMHYRKQNTEDERPSSVLIVGLNYRGNWM